MKHCSTTLAGQSPGGISESTVLIINSGTCIIACTASSPERYWLALMFFYPVWKIHAADPDQEINKRQLH